MSLIRFNWLRRFIRKNTKQISQQSAEAWKRKISFAYMLIAWNAFGFVAYQMITGKSDWARQYKSDEELTLTPAQQWSRTLGIKEAKVYRVHGFNVSEYEINNNVDKGSENETVNNAELVE